jgi:hypothetical protein
VLAELKNRLADFLLLCLFSKGQYRPLVGLAIGLVRIAINRLTTAITLTFRLTLLRLLLNLQLLVLNESRWFLKWILLVLYEAGQDHHRLHLRLLLDLLHERLWYGHPWNVFVALGVALKGDDVDVAVPLDLT